MRIPILILLPLLLLASAAAAQPPATRPYPPVTYQLEIRKNPPLRLHRVIVDLTDPSVHLLTPRGSDADPALGWQTRLRTVSETARANRLAVAVNGDYFSPDLGIPWGDRRISYIAGNLANVCGWAMTDGLLWSTRGAPVSLVVDDRDKLSIAHIARPPAAARQIVSSLWQIVTAGRNTGPQRDRSPRTAAGIDEAGTRLFLLVVDGRRPGYSVGLTGRELADEMIRMGAYNAIGLDSGGSSTLVIRNPLTGDFDVINTPSDGHDFPLPLSFERPVANVLGIRIDAPNSAPPQR